MKESFWKTDWFTGVCLAVTILILSKFSVLQNFDHLVYDLAIRFGSHETGPQVAVIAIDERSTAALGRWPWSRNLLAELILAMNKSQAKIIALTEPLTEAQNDPGLQRLQEIQSYYISSGLVSLAKTDVNSQVRDDLDQFSDLLSQSIKAVDADNNLAEAIDFVGNVLVRMETSSADSHPLSDPTGGGPDSRNRLQITTADNSFSPLTVDTLYPPLEKIEKASLGSGFLWYPADSDGKIRQYPIILKYQDDYYPSLALQIVATSLDFKARDIRPITRHGINIGKFFIPTDRQLQHRTFFSQGENQQPAFAVTSAVDVLSGTLPDQQYQDKIVLIGTTGKNARRHYMTPVSDQDNTLPEVMVLAHTVTSLLKGDGIRVPAWGWLITTLAWLGVLLYLSIYLSSLSQRKAWLYSALFFIFLIGCEFLLLQFSIWIPLLWPAVLLLLGHIAHMTIIFKPPAKEVSASTTENTSQDISADNHYTLGKTFLRQGQLDWAFDKFKKCPYTEDLMNKLDQLANKYEDNQQFVKAFQVYQFMTGHNKDYPGLQQMLRHANQRISHNAAFKTQNPHPDSLIQNDLENLTMLGRYQIEKELGKGAMGKVYLGRDTRINRVVAIKTLPLAAEFEESELEDVKARFFREAETAGKLNHSNIVTIYDAGEENNLAYIAMEYLTGHDLTRYTQANNLLPPKTVLGMIYKAAKALDYAHRHKVIHRDIKPANIMIEPDKKKIVLTDFGIARIIDASRTRTGIVLGTPSYMSPEQLAGSKIDGRSDLFSLGVMLYQLLTGELPFRGDSLSMLMYMISNEPPRDILELKPELAQSYPAIVEITGLALAKDPEQRFQTGDQMARAIKQCANR